MAFANYAKKVDGQILRLRSREMFGQDSRVSVVFILLSKTATTVSNSIMVLWKSLFVIPDC